MKIDRPLRILMIAPTSFFADYGCHVRILEEIRALERRGHTIRLCTYHNGDDLPGIDIQRTVDIPWRKRVVVGSSKHKLYLDTALFFLVARQARAFRPDLIHAHLHEGALIGSVVGRALGIPVVFDYQGSLTEEMLDHGFLRRGGLRHRFFHWLERRIDRMPAVLAPSGYAAERLLHQRGVNSGRVRLLSDAVNTSRFDPEVARKSRSAVRRELGIPEDAPVVVYLGLLADYQGTPLLIDAARHLLARRPDVYVVIAGYPGVRRHAAMAGDMPVDNHVLFPGRIPYLHAPALLAAGDVAVAPKLSRSEANGKVLNYMAMELPTVAIDTPSNRMLLGENGHFVPPHDPAALARAIEAAFDDPPERRHALRARIQADFSWERQVRQLEAIYAGVLAGAGRKPERLTEPAITLSDD